MLDCILYGNGRDTTATERTLETVVVVLVAVFDAAGTDESWAKHTTWRGQLILPLRQTDTAREKSRRTHS